jgi:hypothetical protein
VLENGYSGFACVMGANLGYIWLFAVTDLPLKNQAHVLLLSPNNHKYLRIMFSIVFI